MVADGLVTQGEGEAAVAELGFVLDGVTALENPASDLSLYSGTQSEPGLSAEGILSEQDAGDWIGTQHRPLPVKAGHGSGIHLGEPSPLLEFALCLLQLRDVGPEDE